MNASLSGLRVIDLTTNVAGPFATQILGDLGADVIKVERPGTGDDTRGWGPPFWGDRVESVSFSTLNRSKRSIALDLKSDDGRGVLDRMISGADVLVQNMRPGAFETLGYSWARLHERNPRLIYCEITGFGLQGPRVADPAYDPLIQAYSGLMSITGDESGPPSRIPVSILDRGCGMWTAIGVLNALRNRDSTGVGSLVHTSLLETALMWEPTQVLGYLADGRLPRRLGSGSQGIAPYQAFRTADAYLVIAAGNQRLWEKLCVVLDLPELRTDPRFVDNSRRFENRAELAEIITERLGKQDAATWVETLSAVGIPVARINEVDAVVDDPQVRATGAVVPVDHPTVPGYALLQLPITVDGQHLPAGRRPPELDADRADILRELGVDGAA